MEGLTISIFDVKGDGDLASLSRVHVLAVRKFVDGHLQNGRVFRRNGSEDTLCEGLGYLADADYVIGHDALGFDLPALERAYPDFALPAETAIRDTEVLARLLFTDVKDGDYPLYKSQRLPGNLIGSHAIEAWSHRLGLGGGNYSKGKKVEAKLLGLVGKAAVARHVWGSWNRSMEAHSVRDVETTVALWQRCLDEIRRRKVPLSEIVDRHRAHELMVRQRAAGFGFDAAAALDLAKRLRGELDGKIGEAKAHFGKDFDPTKRAQIVKRLTALGWEPTVFTESGAISVADDVLRPLANRWPICTVLADVFVLQKSLSAIAGRDIKAAERAAASGDVDEEEDGEEIADRPEGKASSAWLLRYDPVTRGIHHDCVIGATVSTRAAHSGPNVGQVKSIEPASKGADPADVAIVKAWSIKTGGEWEETEKRVLVGMAGGYGYECRGLFGPMPGHAFQTGADLTSIEMLALGARLAPFDDGEFLAEVLTPGLDPHKRNVIAFGLAEEGADDDELSAKKPPAKQGFYSMIYGAGDAELGSSVMPAGTPERALVERGRELKATFLARRPAFGKLQSALNEEARCGYLIALDGTRMPVRKRHAMLNLRLQSDGAVIATKWMLLVDERLRDRGLAWGPDYTQLAYVHDELQFGSRTSEHAFLIGEVAVHAAPDAGAFFGYRAPIAAEAKVGHRWRDTH